MKLRNLALVLATAVAVSTMSAPAEAATGKVTVGTIATVTAPYKKSVTVKPRVTVSGNAVVTAKRLTVKKGSKTVASNKTSVSLKAGRYSVTQKVSYKTFVLKNKLTLAISAGSLVGGYDGGPGNSVAECRITDVFGSDQYRATCRLLGVTGDYVEVPLGSVAVDSSDIDAYVYEPTVGDEIYPDSVVVPKNMYRTTKVRSYSATKTAKRSQKLTVKAGKKARTCATKGDFDKIDYDFDDAASYGDSKAEVARILHNGGTRTQYSTYDDMVLEFRDYKTCDKDAYATVGFENGYAYTKSYYSF